MAAWVFHVIEWSRGQSSDLEGTRKSRAPSGVDRVSNGVSTSRKPSSSSRNCLCYGVQFTSSACTHRTVANGRLWSQKYGFIKDEANMRPASK